MKIWRTQSPRFGSAATHCVHFDNEGSYTLHYYIVKPGQTVVERDLTRADTGFFCEGEIQIFCNQC